MKFKNLVAGSVVLFLLFLFTAAGFCAGEGKVTMEQWLKIINPGGAKKPAPPEAAGTDNKGDVDAAAPAAVDKSGAGDKPEIISDQFHQISNNQLCLTRTRIKREVELKACTGDDYQLWSFAPLPGKGKSYYQLWDKPTGRCLEVTASSNDDGGGVAVQSCSESANSQQWTPQAKGNGVFSFKAGHSGKCLTVKQMRKNPEEPPKDSVVQWTCDGGDGQSWKTDLFVNK